MKKSKKFTSLVALSCGLIACTAAGGALLGERESASAASAENVVYSDAFNEENISADNWHVQGEQTKTEYSYTALRVNKYNWAAAMVFCGYTFDDSCRVEIEIKTERYATANPWFALAIGGNATNQAFPHYESAVFSNMTTSYLGFYSAQGGVAQINQDASSQVTQCHTGKGFTSQYATDVTKGIFTFTKQKTEGGFDYYSVTTEYRVGNVTIGSADFSADSSLWLRARTGNPYMCVNVNNPTDILSVKIAEPNGAGSYDNQPFAFDFSFSDKNQTNFSDKFSTLNEETAGTLVHSAIYLGADDAFVERVFTVKSTEERGGIVYKQKVASPNGYLKETYQVSASVNLQSLTKDSAFGVGLGLQSTESAIDSGNFIGFIDYDDTFLQLVVVRDRKITKVFRTKIAKSAVKYGEGVMNEFTLVANSDNTVNVSLGEFSATLRDIRIDGYLAIGNTSLKDGAKNTVFFDNFTYSEFLAQNALSEDMAINFKGKKTVDGKSTFYLNDQEWFKGQNTIFPAKYSASQNLLYFDNATTYSSFGPKKQYSEVAIQFDVTPYVDSSVKAGGWEIGVSFGKKHFSSNLTGSSRAGVYFSRSVNEDTTVAKKTWLTDGVSRTEFTQFNVFKNDSTTYNFLYIIEDGKVKVYFKEASQPASELNILRAEYSCDSTFGYASVYGTGGANFGLTNVKFTNLSPLVKGSDEITVTAATPHAVEGNYTGSRISFRVKEMPATFDLQIADGKTLTFSKTAQELVYTNGTASSSVPFERAFSLANHAYTDIVVEVLNGKLTVRGVAPHESLDMIYEVIAEIPVGFDFSQNYKFSGEQLKLANIKLTSFDEQYKASIAARDYMEEDDKDMSLVQKEDINAAATEEGEGCSGWIAGVPVLGVTVVTAFVLTKKRREE